MTGRGRPSHLSGMWRYLLVMDDEMKADPNLSRRSAAERTVKRHIQDMPNSGSRESTIKLLERYYRRHQSRIADKPVTGAIDGPEQLTAQLQSPRVDPKVAALAELMRQIDRDTARRNRVAMRAAQGPPPPRN